MNIWLYANITGCFLFMQLVKQLLFPFSLKQYPDVQFELFNGHI